MEEKFRKYLEGYTELNNIDLHAKTLRLDKEVYQVVRKKIDFSNFYGVDNIDLLSKQLDQIKDIIPNKGGTNEIGDDNRNLSSALERYKLFLQYLEVAKQMDLYDENSKDFHINGNLHWYFKVKDRNGIYPIIPICKNIANTLEALRGSGFTTDLVKRKLENIFQKNMEFYDSKSENGESTRNYELRDLLKSKGQIVLKDLLESKKQIILQGSPGTGKTRKAIEIAKEMASDNYKLIQFHPAYTYEDFVRGIVAETDDNGNISYEVKNKILVEMAENAINNPNSSFVLIIDEINRANLSSVLGELIYALEYRGEAVESMYEYEGSREITLPENLYIIGTMNTADRSVGHIDYAIRRRFAFVDVNTDESVILGRANKLLFKQVKALFDNLSNEFDKNDVMIGHSYFLREDLALALEYEIKPILQEYRKDGVLTCGQKDIEDLEC